MISPTDAPSADARAVLEVLERQGVQTSAALQARLGKSQPTVSRALQALGPAVVALGSGRARRYALPQAMLGLPARQRLTWVDEFGRREAFGELTLLTGDGLHVSVPGLDLVSRGELPWFLAPLRPQGFLGRLQAQRLAGLGFDANPERWSLAQVLYAAAQLDDMPGALVLGEPPRHAVLDTPAPSSAAERLARYDALADDVAGTLPAGSSAGGEQAKFLCTAADGGAELVKFTPPRGTPFGERWHDLLQAEALALQVLAEQGIPTARTEVLGSARRSYLVSHRFDRLAAEGGVAGRMGPAGRRHAVALDAVHAAFVGGPRQHWAATCRELARQHRLPAAAPAQVTEVLHFGRLIGNTDMHLGNLSFVPGPTLQLAPAYDMLPMMYAPLPGGEVPPRTFQPDWPLPPQRKAWQTACAAARAFWRTASADLRISAPFRQLCEANAHTLEHVAPQV